MEAPMKHSTPNEQHAIETNNKEEPNVLNPRNIFQGKPTNLIQPNKHLLNENIHRHNLQRQRCLFTATSTPSSAAPTTTKFNVAAPPFVSTTKNALPSQNVPKMYPAVTGQSHDDVPLAVDSRVWRTTPSTRQPHQHYYNYCDDLFNMQPTPSLNPYKIIYSPRLREVVKSSGPVVSPNGIIQIFLRDDVRIEITLDKAIRVFNDRSQIVIALSSHNGGSAALIHPNGRVYQFGSRVEIMAHDGMGSNNYVRYAKMWYKGISFTGENCALIYLVDSAGTRTTTDTFIDMTCDITATIFYQNSQYGPEYCEAILSVLQGSNYWVSEEGVENYDINGFRISQSPDGMVKVTRIANKCLIRTSPSNGSATITTPFLHCTASLGQTSHLFVRRGERRMHFDGASFVVRNAGHSAGFNEQNLLKVY